MHNRYRVRTDNYQISTFGLNLAVMFLQLTELRATDPSRPGAVENKHRLLAAILRKALEHPIAIRKREIWGD